MEKNNFGYGMRLLPLEEGGWVAEVPELEGCKVVGATVEEALAALSDVIGSWLEVAREEGWEVPPPRTYSEVEYSGKFTLRVPKSLHKTLVQQAEQEGVSLNQYVLSLISFNLGFKMQQKLDQDAFLSPLNAQFLERLLSSKTHRVEKTIIEAEGGRKLSVLFMDLPNDIEVERADVTTANRARRGF